MSAPIVYAAADLHGILPDIPGDAEVLLLVGDICPDFPPRYGGYVVTDGVAQSRWLDTTFRRWLTSRPQGCRVVATWGNHDFVGERPECRDFFRSLPWTLLIDELLDLGGLTVYGTPWVPGLPYWAFYGTERRLKARAEAVPQCDILMSHGPPYKAGDYIPGGTDKQVNKYGNLHGIHAGDRTLRARLERPDAPGIVVCGHIHEDRGVHLVHKRPGITEVFMDGSDSVAVYNVAAVDANYQLHVNPWTRIHVR